jgi:hypothetical protein
MAFDHSQAAIVSITGDLGSRLLAAPALVNSNLGGDYGRLTSGSSGGHGEKRAIRSARVAVRFQLRNQRAQKRVQTCVSALCHYFLGRYHRSIERS